MASLPILVLNSGSSSIKFSVWESADAERRKLLEGEVEGIGAGGEAGQKSGKFWIKSWLNGSDGAKLVDEAPALPDTTAAFKLIADALKKPPFSPAGAIGHRMVCGGPTVTENQRLTPQLIEEMERYTAFAPLHTPIAIFIMRQAMQLFEGVPEFICLDSWFHRDLPQVAQQLAIPQEYSALGVRRFGAHGLSYESIVAHLRDESPSGLPSRLIVAHLGNGASICAIRDGKSVDTSMGLTPTGGLISGSRTGDIDPGVLLFILRKLNATATSAADAANQLETIVNKKSGLLGMSGLTNDMRTLRLAIADGNDAARRAVNEFTTSSANSSEPTLPSWAGWTRLSSPAASAKTMPPPAPKSAPDWSRSASSSIQNATSFAANPPSPLRIRESQSALSPPAEDLMIVNHVRQLIE